ncbi:hypothetical protein J2X69_002357 [Algoriphagus sp. 4150]|uniref:hypothetical protein n=1 Tax=Algoriphagus sp. 4150 TaxID=2817756 RepID=UPI00285AB6BC|nr:hypothetical protein [Algoriphagus sp. 4150]MDR7130010.1 hypothetical protein [Algoriphagus sp. 4150]
MTYKKTLLLIIHLLIFNSSFSQSGINVLFEQLKKERFMPKQQEIANQIYDSLEFKLKDLPAHEVLSLIEPEYADHIRVLNSEFDDKSRELIIIVLVHKNYFKEVYFPDATGLNEERIYAEEYYPMIQWRASDGNLKSSKLFTKKEHRDPGSDYKYQSYKGTESDFYEIHKLPATNNELYLLISMNPSDQMPALLSFFVLEIKDDELNFEYPAFEAMSPLLQCTIYDNSAPDAYFNYFEYNKQEHRISLKNLKKQETVTVNKDVYRFSFKILNPNKEVEIQLDFDGVEFQKVN